MTECKIAGRHAANRFYVTSPHQGILRYLTSNRWRSIVYLAVAKVARPGESGKQCSSSQKHWI